MMINPRDPLEIRLLESIRDKWGALIVDACAQSAVPVEFVAALIANESGGDPTKKRFEPHVLLELWEVLMRRRADFGSIGRDDLLQAITPALGPSLAPIASPLILLDGLATSVGLTQIMGYETIPFSLPLISLGAPATGLRITNRMLSDFCERNRLNPKKHFAEMLDCWNTGRPHARTADPDYVPNGLGRIDLYRAICEEPPAAPPSGPKAISA